MPFLERLTFFYGTCSRNLFSINGIIRISTADCANTDESVSQRGTADSKAVSGYGHAWVLTTNRLCLDSDSAHSSPGDPRPRVA